MSHWIMRMARNTAPEAPTMPPGPADADALAESQRLRHERTADFWACVERRAREIGLGDKDFG